MLLLNSRLHLDFPSFSISLLVFRDLIQETTLHFFVLSLQSPRVCDYFLIFPMTLTVLREYGQVAYKMSPSLGLVGISLRVWLGLPPRVFTVTWEIRPLLGRFSLSTCIYNAERKSEVVVGNRCFAAWVQVLLLLSSHVTLDMLLTSQFLSSIDQDNSIFLIGSLWESSWRTCELM